MSESPQLGAPERSIVIVTGRSPAGSCGVEDYTQALTDALAESGVTVEHVKAAGVDGWRSVLKGSRRAKVLHFQYPVSSWRTSLMPVAIVLICRLLGSARIMVTLHEFTRAHVLRRLICVALVRLAHCCVTTSKVESRALRRWTPGGREVTVIPVGNNIRVGQSALGARRGVLFFGLLAPGKGLERFLAIVSRPGGECTPSVVVGLPVAGGENWLAEMRRTYPLTVFHIGLDAEGVSKHLSAAAIALLPYPDGISDRRTTALAALAHGLQVVSTRGSATTDEHETIYHLVDNDDEAQDRVQALVNGLVGSVDSKAVEAHLNARSWPEIARAHIALYERARHQTFLKQGTWS
jgi:glycosyltransferase involved in cell wall biosynthesis